jgi:hypothetical protein
MDFWIQYTIFLISLFSFPVNIVFVYFWAITIFSMIHRGWFLNTNWKQSPVNTDRSLRKLIFLIATKGGYPHIVARGVEEILDSKIPAVIEIITENSHDVDTLKKRFKNHPDIKIFLVPKSFQTENGSMMKARALEFVRLAHQKMYSHPEDYFVVHYDEESVIERHNVVKLYQHIQNTDSQMLAGPIYYPLDYLYCSLLSRSMESIRAFVEPECAFGVNQKSPRQGHGSNLVLRMDVEDTIGWDFGLDDDRNPYIAEDLLFILKGTMMGFKSSWHGVPMLEQPAFHYKDSYRQRNRWVTGTIQIYKVLDSIPEFSKRSWIQKVLIKLQIGGRISMYALGFVPAFLNGIIFCLYLVGFLKVNNWIDGMWALSGYAIWTMAYQYGVYMNLKYSTISWWKKLREHLLVFVIAPALGILETRGAFTAFWSWQLGAKKKLIWNPTQKTSKVIDNTSVYFEKKQSHKYIPSWLTVTRVVEVVIVVVCVVGLHGAYTYSSSRASAADYIPHSLETYPISDSNIILKKRTR